MKTTGTIVNRIFGIFLMLTGIVHFIKPELFYPFIPEFLPRALCNVLAGGVELILGIGSCIPSCQKRSAIGIFLLMILFLPLHVIDVFKEQPAIGSYTIALIRLPVQFLLIGTAWYMISASAKRTQG